MSECHERGRQRSCTTGSVFNRKDLIECRGGGCRRKVAVVRRGGLGSDGPQMASGNCSTVDLHYWKGGRCCDRCPAGSYVRTECDGTKATECVECRKGFYTETNNHLKNCHICRICYPKNKQRILKDCRAQQNTVCECERGFYCTNDTCDHCRSVSPCALGDGITAPATRTNDTICAPCEEGSYSNVTDFHSRCQRHTRCEDVGRVLKTPGTRSTDVICGAFKSDCQWILPAGLWSGLVMTALLLFAFFCWREKRKFYRAARPMIPVTFTKMIPATPDPPDLPLPPIQMKHYCQESCIIDGSKFPLTATDDNAVGGRTHTPDNLDRCPPTTPLKTSVSFVASGQLNGSAGTCSGTFRRSYSEPQEDEWGT